MSFIYSFDTFEIYELFSFLVDGKGSKATLNFLSVAKNGQYVL